MTHVLACRFKDQPDTFCARRVVPITSLLAGDLERLTFRLLRCTRTRRGLVAYDRFCARRGIPSRPVYTSNWSRDQLLALQTWLNDSFTPNGDLRVECRTDLLTTTASARGGRRDSEVS